VLPFTEESETQQNGLVAQVTDFESRLRLAESASKGGLTNGTAAAAASPEVLRKVRQLQHCAVVDSEACGAEGNLGCARVGLFWSVRASDAEHQGRQRGRSFGSLRGSTLSTISPIRLPQLEVL